MGDRNPTEKTDTQSIDYNLKSSWHMKESIQMEFEANWKPFYWSAKTDAPSEPSEHDIHNTFKGANVTLYLFLSIVFMLLNNIHIQ